ncbi:hypothetical protein E4U17_000163 [Claviceps sp. LM77 group G4]|nr:hypothetical protein E4U17_000163 [Claviceps sp. LM77 group G4]
MQKWPTSLKTVHPTLLHNDELPYHYGAVVASSRESKVCSLRSSNAGIIPETRSIMVRKLHKNSHRSTPSGALLSHHVQTGGQASAVWKEETYALKDGKPGAVEALQLDDGSWYGPVAGIPISRAPIQCLIRRSFHLN